MTLEDKCNLYFLNEEKLKLRKIKRPIKITW